MKTSELLEKKLVMPGWAMEEQADFRQFVAKFGFRLNTRLPVFRLPDQWMLGGDIKDLNKDDLLGPEHRFKAFKKGLAVYLMDKAKSGRYVKIVSGGWNPSPHYVNPDSSVRKVEDDIDSTVYPTRDRSGQQFKPLELRVTWSISEPK